jgi:hypothetical protein
MNRSQVVLVAGCAVAVGGCSSSSPTPPAPTPAALRVIVVTDSHPSFVTEQAAGYEVNLESSGCAISKASGFRLSLVGRLHGEQLVDSAGPPGHGLPGLMTIPADTWTVVLTAHSSPCPPWRVTVRPDKAATVPSLPTAGMASGARAQARRPVR